MAEVFVHSAKRGLLSTSATGLPMPKCYCEYELRESKKGAGLKDRRLKKNQYGKRWLLIQKLKQPKKKTRRT